MREEGTKTEREERARSLSSARARGRKSVCVCVCVCTYIKRHPTRRASTIGLLCTTSLMFVEDTKERERGYEARIKRRRISRVELVPPPHRPTRSLFCFDRVSLEQTTPFTNRFQTNTMLSKCLVVAAAALMPVSQAFLTSHFFVDCGSESTIETSTQYCYYDQDDGNYYTAPRLVRHICTRT